MAIACNHTATQEMLAQLPPEALATLESLLGAGRGLYLVGELGASRYHRRLLAGFAEYITRVALPDGECLQVGRSTINGAEVVLLQYDNPLCAGEPWLYATDHASAIYTARTCSLLTNMHSNLGTKPR